MFDKKISKLFKLLDSDHDGVISSVRINVDKISAKKLKILAPLFIEMEDMGISLDISEFREAIKKLIKVGSLIT